MNGRLHPRALARAYELAQPLNAYLELTYACNWRCVFCYNPRHHDLLGLTAADWIDVLDQLRLAGTLTVTLTGGEPLAHPGWLEILDAAVSRRFVTSIYTNGSLIDAGAANRIAAFRAVTVEISIHGGTPEVHDTTTGRPGSFDAMLSGVRLLRSRSVSVHLKSPVTKLNEHQIDDMISIARELDVPFRLDATLVPRHDGSLAPLDLTASASARMRVIELGLEERASDQMEERPAGAANCGLGRITLAIGPEGDVYPCIQWRRSSAGNVKHQSFADIWSSVERAAAADTAVAAGSMLQTRDDRGLAQYCPAAAAGSTGDPLQPDAEYEERARLTADVLARRQR